MSEKEDFKRRQEIADEIALLQLRLVELRGEYAEILTRLIDQAPADILN